MLVEKRTNPLLYQLAISYALWPYVWTPVVDTKTVPYIWNMQMEGYHRVPSCAPSNIS